MYVLLRDIDGGPLAHNIKARKPGTPVVNIIEFVKSAILSSHNIALRKVNTAIPVVPNPAA
jgi:hypothetical protein